jgi:hypothetical protein
VEVEVGSAKRKDTYLLLSAHLHSPPQHHLLSPPLKVRIERGTEWG